MSLPANEFHCSLCQHQSANYCTLECSCCCSGEDAEEYFGIESEKDMME